MGKYVAEETVKQMIQSGHNIKGADVIVLGLTFKENCPDLRNSKVIDVIRELKSYGCNVIVHDPVAESTEAQHEYGVRKKDKTKNKETGKNLMIARKITKNRIS